MLVSAQAYNIWAAHLNKHTDICARTLVLLPRDLGQRVCVRLLLGVHFWELEVPTEYATNT